MLVKRTDVLIEPNPNRVLLMPFDLKYEQRISRTTNQVFYLYDEQRISRITNYVFNLYNQEVNEEVEKIYSEFNDRHRNFIEECLIRCEEIIRLIGFKKNLSENHKILVGSYFLKEFSVESAALFNPSIVLHPDQSNLKNGECKFILSLRATGEGHISSIVFRSGILDSNSNVVFEKPSKYITAPSKVSINKMNYELNYDPSIDISERIIFPLTPDESNGIEDARFVKFSGSGNDTYFATYSAYDGKNIVSKLLQTNEFTQFQIKTLNGSESKNKGMALFPRKINGRYAMLSRQDGESNFIMYSDDLYNWNSKEILTIPEHSWELVQMGNCGAPIETDEGWLVLTHGVGPLRKYSINAILLDLNAPTKIIGRLKQPILEANENEREGYVPNVVYSCGGIIHNDQLVLPYAVSDYLTSFAFVNLKELLQKLIKSK